MAKKKQTANEVQLKARRTSLGKKSNEELINIILRKDKTERNLNAKVNDLMEALDDEACKKINYENRIAALNKDVQGLDDLVKTKQEKIDNILASKNDLIEEIKLLNARIDNIKYCSKIKRNVIFCCVGIITILILLLVF